MFKNKKVLVAGGTGMIGRQLVNILVEKGAKVFIVSLDEPNNLPDNVEYKFCDLREFSTCISACEGMDYVFNLAGVKGSPKMCKEQPADFMIPMLQFNTNLMEAARRTNVKWYLYTSSVGVYQPAEILKEDDVWETFPSKNDWFAGWAKRMGELQAQAYSIQYGWNAVSIVRPANVYGPYDNFDPNNAMVIPSLIRKAFENNVLEVWGDGSPIRDFIHAQDVARGMVFAVENSITEPLNLGSGTGCNIKQIAEIISKKMNKDVVWLSDKPTGDKIRILDASRANSYGFNTIVPLEQGIEDTIAWFFKHQKEVDMRYNTFTKNRGENVKFL